MSTKIYFKKIRESSIIPSMSTDLAACFDLHASIEFPVCLEPGEYKLIPCGFCICMPENMEMLIRSRSGLAAKNGIFVLNSGATVDPDYCIFPNNEIKVILMNTGKEQYTIHNKDRIAQAAFRFFPNVIIEEIVSIDDWPGNSRNSDRKGGFGSTGV